MNTEPFSQPARILSPLIDEEHNERILVFPTTYLSITSIESREIKFTPPYISCYDLSTIPSGPIRPSKTLAGAAIFTRFCLSFFGFQTIVASSIATTLPPEVIIERTTVLNCLMTTEFTARGLHSFPRDHR